MRGKRAWPALSLDKAVESAEPPPRFYGVHGSPRGLWSLVVVSSASLLAALLPKVSIVLARSGLRSFARRAVLDFPSRAKTQRLAG